MTLGCCSGDFSYNFGVYKIDRAGGSATPIIVHDTKEYNHVREVEDGTGRLIFSSYNNYGSDGYAVETNGYANTEIGICNADGTNRRLLIGPVAGEINVNGYPMPQGNSVVDNGFVYIHQGVSETAASLKVFDLDTETTIATLPTEVGKSVTDPHVIGEQCLHCQYEPGPTYPGNPNDIINTLRRMDLDGSNNVLLATPSNTNPTGDAVLVGYYDGKISPNGQYVTAMYHPTANTYLQVVFDLSVPSAAAIALPSGVNAMAVAEWITNSELVMYLVSLASPSVWNGIWTMGQTGQQNARVPFTRDWFWTMPNILRSDPNIIIASGKYNRGA